MPKARTIVGHGIGRALDIVEESEIAKVTLVQTRDEKKVGRWTRCGSGAFAMPDDRRNVVAQTLGCALPAVHFLHQDVLMGDSAREFQIRVGDGTLGIACRD
jgi:hypothetical protein